MAARWNRDRSRIVVVELFYESLGTQPLSPTAHIEALKEFPGSIRRRTWHPDRCDKLEIFLLFAETKMM